jgi:poly-gamma-glutamate synthesis protein (capsule biosynthesis protein)
VALKDAGLDILVTANNHSADRGKVGIERTIQVLDSFNIVHTGTFRDTVERMNDYPLMVAKNGIKLVLLNYTYGTNGLPVTKPNVVNMLDTMLMKRDLIRAKELNPDILIVFTHWGLEYQSQPSAPQRRITDFCFRNGANLVIGSHPHVLQPMEWRAEQNQLVVYSLGNFVSGQRDRYKNDGGMVQAMFTKITQDSTVRTSLDSVGYILEWVYRTADEKRDYFILPVPTFEADTTGFIADDTSRQAFKLFIDDTRKLFKNHNLNVNEITRQPAKQPE